MRTSITSVNFRGLSALKVAALSDSTPAASAQIAISTDVWRRVGDAALQRLAQVPVLLFDLHFDRMRWWGDALTRGVTVPPFADNRQFPEGDAIGLARELLMVIWVVGRKDWRTASLISGMSGPMALQVADLTPHMLNRIADAASVLLRPRWSDTSSFWESLLVAAAGEDESTLHLARLHSVQLSAAAAIRIEESRISTSGTQKPSTLSGSRR